MIYRIDYKNFLLYAVDYFALSELKNFQYAIISAAIHSGSRLTNVNKVPQLYPDASLISMYGETKNYEAFKKAYFEELHPSDTPKNEFDPMEMRVYNSFIIPLQAHVDIMIICHESENFIIDALSDFIKEKFKAEVIDLNKLFTDGKIGAIYIDRDEIHDSCVPISRYCAKRALMEKMSTADGREMILKKMSKKDKIKHCKLAGIRVRGDEKDLDSILLSAWEEERNVNMKGFS